MGLRTIIRSLTAAADGVERATEWALDQVFARGSADVFDFTRELIRVLDFHAQPSPAGGKIAPNRYTLSLRPDMYREYAALISEYEKELTERVKQELRARRYQKRGQVEVKLIEGDAGQRDELVIVCVISMDTVVQTPTLQLLGGGKRYPLRNGTTTVGRMPGTDICLTNEQVSRRHADIRATPGGYLLVDRKSANGTFLNGQRLTPEKPETIRDGDRIRFATVEFEVVRVK
jgi:hypothetical protein